MRRGNRRTAHLDIEALVTGYESGQSARTLAEKFNTGRSTVLTRLREAGVRIRRPSEWEEKHLNLHPQHWEPFIELVDGLMLGDGTLPRAGGLRVEQSHVRQGWLEDLQKELRALGAESTMDEVVRPERIRKDGRLLPAYRGFLLRTPAYVELREQRQRWYPGGVKHVPDDVRITQKSVAAWISGDGTGNKAGALVLCTDDFTEEGVRLLIDRLDGVFGVRARRVSGGKPKIGLYRKDDVFRLREILLPQMSECCHYKFQHARVAQKKGKLAVGVVQSIREKYDADVLLSQIAAEHGLSRSAVNNIGLRKVYKWVPEKTTRSHQPALKKSEKGA